MLTQSGHAAELSRDDRKILVKALREVLEDGGQPDKALKAVAQQWAELDAKNPQLLADFQISLGLLP